MSMQSFTSGGKLSAQRSLHVAIQCGKSSLRTHTNPKTSNMPCIRSPWLVTRRSPDSRLCARLHRCLRTRASEMPVIKVSQSTLEELIELVRQRPKIIFSSLYHTAAIVLRVWLGKSIQHLYTQYKLVSAHLPQGMETGTLHPHVRRRSFRLCRTFLVSGGFNTRECESKGKKEWMTEILLMKNKLNVFAKAAIEEWSGRCILGQRCKILLNAFHNDP